MLCFYKYQLICHASCLPVVLPLLHHSPFFLPIIAKEAGPNIIDTQRSRQVNQE